MSGSTRYLRRVAAVLLATSVLGAQVATAQTEVRSSAREQDPSAGEMTVDLLVARPVGTAMFAVSTAAFLVSLPFTMLGGNVESAGEKLVVEPAKETFGRCLGCTRRRDR